jgi:pimeloyl-ACP methyl ester carboxylesterase
LTKRLYIFCGLGANEKAFRRLDFSGYDVTFIKWIKPLRKDTVESYALKLIEQITATRPVLIGLSFGGLMAVEAAKHVETEKIILISSAKTKNEIPFYFRAMGKVGMQRLIPYSFLQKPNSITNFLFGAHTDGDKELLKQMLVSTDLDFLKWALRKITSWNNIHLHPNLFHIHGTTDRILPYRFISCNHTIENGGHLMVLNRAEEVGRLVRGEL